MKNYVENLMHMFGHKNHKAEADVLMKIGNEWVICTAE